MLDGFIEEVSQIILKESRSFTDNIQVVMEVASTGDRYQGTNSAMSSKR